MGYSLWGRKESDTTERLTQTHTFFIYSVGPKAALLNHDTSKRIACILKEYSSEIVKMSSIYTVYKQRKRGFQASGWWRQVLGKRSGEVVSRVVNKDYYTD